MKTKTSIDIESKYHSETNILNQLDSAQNLVLPSKLSNKTKQPFLTKKTKISLILLFFLFMIAGIAVSLFFLIKPSPFKTSLKFPPPADKSINNIDIFRSNSTLSQWVLENYIKKDKQYEQIISKLDNASADIINQGFIFQFYSASFQHFSSNPSILKFYPIHQTDHYLFVVNKTNNTKSQMTVTSNNNDDLLSASSLIDQSQGSSTTNNNSTQTQSQIFNVLFTITDTAEDQVEIVVTMNQVVQSSSGSSDTVNTEQNNIEQLASQWYSDNKTLLINSTGGNLLINMIQCQMTRSDQVLFCFRPFKLDDVIYLMMLNALNLYLPDFTKNHLDIFMNSTQTQNGSNVTSNDSISSTSLTSTTDSNGYVSQSTLSSNKTSNQSTQFLIDLSSQSNLNSTTLIDPYTGKTLYANCVSYFNAYPKQDMNYTDEETKFFQNINSNTSISLFFINSNSSSNNVINFYYDYLDFLDYDNITDPINQVMNSSNMTIVSNFTNQTNQTRLLRVLDDSSFIVAESWNVLFDKNILGIHFQGDYHLVCFIDNICDLETTITVGSLKIYDVLCETIHVYPLQSVYKAYAFLKVIVLDNIIKLGEMLVDIEQNIYKLVGDFLNVSLTIINDIKNYITTRKPDIMKEFDYFIYVEDGLLNFTTVMFPIMEQTFIELSKDVSGLTSLEMNKEYQLYYDISQNISQSLEEEIIILQANFNIMNISNDQLNTLWNNVNNFLTNYDNLTNKIYSNFILYGPIVNSWSSEIVKNITELMYQNDIFHYLEAIGKLDFRFNEIMNNNSYLVNGSSDELIRSYQADLATLNQTFAFQRSIIQKDINTLNSLISSKYNNNDPNATCLCEKSDEQLLLFQRSILFNQNLYDGLFTMYTLGDLRIRLDYIYINQINLKFTYLKEQYQLKYDVYKKEYFDFYDLIQNEINDVLNLITKKELVNIQNLLNEALILYNECKAFVELIHSLYQKIIDPNYSPTPQEIIAMKQVDLVKIPDYLSEIYAKFNEIMIEFDYSLKLIPTEIYQITHPNVTRLLQEDLLQKYLGNIYDYVMNFIDNNYIDINLVDGHIIDKFFISTKYLEINDTSFFSYIFSNFQNQKQQFLILHNQFINQTIQSFVLDNSIKYLAQSALIQGLRQHLQALIPAEGLNPLISYDCLRQITIPLYRMNLLVFSFELYLSLGYSIKGSALWGFSKSITANEKKINFYVLLGGDARLFAQATGLVNAFIIKVQTSLTIDVISCHIAGYFDMILDSTDKTFGSLGKVHIDMTIYVLTVQLTVSIQFLIITWIRIHLFWFIYIWLPWFSWSDPITLANIVIRNCWLSLFFNICSAITVIDQVFFKTSKNGLDSFERFLINLAESLFFEDLTGNRRMLN